MLVCIYNKEPHWKIDKFNVISKLTYFQTKTGFFQRVSYLGQVVAEKLPNTLIKTIRPNRLLIFKQQDRYVDFLFKKTDFYHSEFSDTFHHLY